MPRRPRMYLPGLPYHIVQRGNNREACFYAVEDYECYLNYLVDSLSRYEVALHAYVLMTNHIHLLMSPKDKEGISNVMKVTGSRFAHYMNKRYRRTGTLWEGRHKPSVVDSESYLLTCYRYIELNPVAAGMVVKPEEYRWSSYGVNAWGDKVSWITPHEEYVKLGVESTERCKIYRELFEEKLSDEDLHSIRKATHYCQPLGDEFFRCQIEEKLGRSVGQPCRGRPKNELI